MRPAPRLSPWLRFAACGCLLLAAACGPSTPPPPAAPPAPPPRSGEQKIAWYQDCWRSFNDQAWDKFADCYTDTATSTNFSTGAPPLQGRTAIIDLDKQDVPAYPDRRGELVLVLGNGSHLLSVARWTGTNDGPLPSPDGKTSPATHKKIGLYVVHTAELDASGMRVASDAVFADAGTMAAQLGLSKAPARKVLTATGAPPTIVVAKNDDTETKNVAAFRAAVEAANKGDIAAFQAVLAPNYKLIDVTMPTDVDAKAAIKGMHDYQKAFPDMTLNASTVWAAGDYVVASGTFTGTNKGPMPSIGLKKATGKAVSVPFIEVMKFSGGKIVEDWTVYNGATFAAQLGLQ